MNNSYISHKSKLIYFGVPRCASRSIQKALYYSDLFSDQDNEQQKTINNHSIIDLENEFQNLTMGELFYYDIESMKKKMEQKGYNFEDYLKITVVRNPWECYLSMLKYYVYNKIPPYTSSNRRKIDLNSIQDTSNELFFLSFSFHSFSSYYCDKNKNKIVDRVIKFENFKEEIIKTIKERGSIILPEIIKTNENPGIYKYDLHDYYEDSDLIEYIAEKELQIIKDTGYTFGNEQKD